MSNSQKSKGSWMLIAVCYCLVVQICAQQFYPNGRYGRRDSTPPLPSGSREMSVSFFGDGTVSCVYTGYQELYRCSRREESTHVRSIE
ncbi:uncharacterized protein LOC111623440 [Centruroides sculpturatus]|uniref:uncharacterized protein LOC111623440 n=1 Tax=Centruroides sculpturatus TaxID=218467 RepID=UPI000C6EEB95|nr:uncharacterized protein LOC111623440 [Centruroides sculpturatus]